MCSASSRTVAATRDRSEAAAACAVLAVFASTVACSEVRPHEPAPSASAFRVCADANNLPFSNERLEGFENALAALVAAELGQRVEYTWWPQRRGFIRSTLQAGVCDVVMGVPRGFEMALTTRPYYRSSYVFVTRDRDGLRLRSMDDPRLRLLTLGIHVVGDDYAAVPPGEALAARGIVGNVRGYSVYGDYDAPNPPADLIAAVAKEEVDVAIAWGPLAGFFAGRAPTLLAVAPVEPPADTPGFQFDIAMAVRTDSIVLRDRLNDVLDRRAADVDALLTRFHVPRVVAPALADGMPEAPGVP
jgi:quinoprotein dehydrogenase-associated probable ABC transporter substrate-binding protein